MCGIAGVASLMRPLPEDVEAALEQMLAMQAHRGPDDRGIVANGSVALGANRLAIMDLSARAHMPMVSGDDWLVFNGEIYNHVELRQALSDRGHRFESRGDTEVLLRCLMEYGTDCLPMLRGMFAFAWWSGAARRLMLARDRIGIKPLAYRLDDGVLQFASESKVLGWRERRVDAEALGWFVAGGTQPAGATFFSGVRQLMPGTYAVFDRDDLRLETYWTLPSPERAAGERSMETDDLDRLITESVRLHLRSDAPVGAYLSGGLDSTLVASIAAGQTGSIATFSGTVPTTDRRFDERPWIAHALKGIPGEHHEVLIEPDGWWQDLLRMVWYLDQPTAGPATPAHLAVSRLAAREVKVVLGGQGGDEIFGGYHRHLWAHTKDLLGGGRLDRLARGLPSLAGIVRDVGLTSVREKFGRRAATSALLVRDVARALPSPGAAGNGDESHLARLQRADLTEYLPRLLHVEDRASMAASVEARVPLLDHELVEAVWPVSANVKLPAMRLKGLLRRVAARHVVPEIAARPDKRGFPIPIGPWFAGPLHDPVAAVLDSDAVERHGVFDRSQLRVTLERHRAGSVDASLPLWIALSVELWFATFIDRPGDSPLTA